MKKDSLLGKAEIRRSALLALLAVAYLQFYFLSVLTEIDSLPTVLVFVPAKTVG